MRRRFLKRHRLELLGILSGISLGFAAGWTAKAYALRRASQEVWT